MNSCPTYAIFFFFFFFFFFFILGGGGGGAFNISSSAVHVKKHEEDSHIQTIQLKVYVYLTVACGDADFCLNQIDIINALIKESPAFSPDIVNISSVL